VARSASRRVRGPLAAWGSWFGLARSAKPLHKLLAYFSPTHVFFTGLTEVGKLLREQWAEQRDREFADSPQEESGFELVVPL
jgi:hypothetical protein